MVEKQDHLANIFYIMACGIIYKESRIHLGFLTIFN